MHDVTIQPLQASVLGATYNRLFKVLGMKVLRLHVTKETFLNMKQAILADVALFLSSAFAHMLMANPVPFNNPANGPLKPDGSDYPCQITPDKPFYIKAMNIWTVGTQEALSFTGTAVHGGGSCQISYTTDIMPTKNSKFKVIYSVEGGCPGKLTAETFNFTIPKELPNGQGSMSWSWANRIGNREFYQNCAAVTITGGNNGTSAFEKLPDMAVVNINGSITACKNQESFDYTYENPGEYKTRIGEGPFRPLCGSGTTPLAPSAGAPTASPSQLNNGVYSSPAFQASALSTSVTASQPPQPTPTLITPTGRRITSTIHTLVTMTAPVVSQTQAPRHSTYTSVQPTQTSTALPSQALSTPSATSCATHGQLLCNGTKKFGLCNHGKIIWQSVAEGTKCQDGPNGGQIAKRKYTHRAQRPRI
ncbi:hypothetical protein B0J11DRAFT_510953 [Dendryphion nanum]|uniref:Lytic polysaccharide monooxygenase n=1 Tax=Dendryphion nanum TaxID=256645 RepID=A0A9P9D7Q2_9PLEO|nr:hypothetical protein B0J11DRAFT_510953 [Dendryphion nanum]